MNPGDIFRSCLCVVAAAAAAGAQPKTAHFVAKRRASQ